MRYFSINRGGPTLLYHSERFFHRFLWTRWFEPVGRPKILLDEPLAKFWVSTSPPEGVIDLRRHTPHPVFQFRIENDDLGPVAPAGSIHPFSQGVLNLCGFMCLLAGPFEVETDERILGLFLIYLQHFGSFMIASGVSTGMNHESVYNGSNC